MINRRTFIKRVLGIAALLVASITKVLKAETQKPTNENIVYREIDLGINQLVWIDSNGVIHVTTSKPNQRSKRIV